MDFPETRRCLSALDPWLQEIAETCGVPSVSIIKDRQLDIKFQQKTPEVVQTAKAVRMVSGLNAAMCLADLGYTVEASTLLRTITEFAIEIIAIGKGIGKGELPSALKKFVEDYFRPLPSNLEEFRNQEKTRYITRKKLYKLHKCLLDNMIGSGEEVVEKMHFMDKTLDSYIHGGYQTAMELYDPNLGAFSVTGTPHARNCCVTKVALAGKLYYCMIALEMMALSRGLGRVVDEIKQARITLERSPEYDGSVCDPPTS